MNSTVMNAGSSLAKSAPVGALPSILDGDFSPAPARSTETILLLDSRMLERECFRQTLRAHDSQLNITAFGSADEWVVEKDLHPRVSAVVLNIGGRRISDPGVGKEISDLVAQFKPVPVVVLAGSEDLTLILKALEYGARGYIPSSVGIDVCIEAIRLAIAGGIFVPASSVMAMSKAIESGDVARPMAGMFTPRQAEVVMALRQGKANKIIAYELNLRESTVKVHIRNIMRKLRATNRTEVAYKIGDLFPREFADRG